MGRKVTCEAYTDRGIVGPRGASAYEQAVEGGYTGTLEDFEAALASDINTVAGSISDVNTVGVNISDVNTVAGISSDVSSVAGNATDVSTVAGISSDVTQVASISSAVSTVSSHDSDVTLVADNMASVMTTASHVGDVQTVASVASDVSTVAGISSNVTSVAGNATNINKVANNESNINTVAGNTSDINTVVTNLTDIQTVANNATGISSVAGDLTNIDTVASNLTDIGTVATNISDVSSVAGDLSNIDTAVANLAAINAAPTAASNAATSATNAQTWAEGTDAQVAALGGTKSSKGWAARAEEIITSIGTVMRYKGSVADYAALQAIQNPTLGDTYNVLDTGSNYTWDGTNWDAISSTVDLSAYRTSAAQDVIDAGKADNTNKVNGAPLSNTGSYFYGECTTAATTTAKEVSIPSITELKAGQVILVKPTNTADGAGMTLKLNNFTAYTVLYCGASITTSTDSIVMQANTPSWFVFDGTYWRFAGYGRDNNTTYTINYMLSCGIHLAGTGTYAVTRYALLMQKLDGTWEKLQNTSEQYTTATTKTVNTRGFVLGDGQIRYYSTTTAKANGAVISNSYLYEKYTSIDARYSFNCGATPSWSDGDYIYLVGTIGADGLFYLDSTTWWANALPNSNDGKVYVRVGKYVSDAYKISLDYMHPVFYHDGTSVKLYTVDGNKLDKSSLGVANGVATLDANTKVPTAQIPNLNGTYVDLSTADQQITAQKIVRNNWITNALYILANISGWTWYKALSWTGSRIRVGDSSNVGLQLETNESHIKAKIGANTYDALTTADKAVANGVASLDANTKVPVTQLPVLTGADGVNAGIAGLVPAPTATDNNKFLKGDGTWDNPAGGGSSRNVGEIVESTVPLTDAGLHLLDGSLLSGSGSYANFVTYMAGVYTDHSELFTTEADWQTSVTNYGVCGKFVYDSVNNTVRLPKKSSTERHLVKSTVSGENWCDVYSDGLCEQGGVFTGNFATGNQFALLKPYKDTNYTVMTNALQYNTTIAACFSVNTKTTTYFAGEAFRGSNGNIRVGILQWEAKGYIDASDLGSETTYQYIVIANSTKTEIEVDIDEIATDLNGKADADLSNVSNTSGFRKLIEVYRNGASWHKVYNEYDPSDGTFVGKWCEQGGTHDNGSDVRTFSATPTFTKTFADTNYYVTFTSVSTSSSGICGIVGTGNKSTSSITMTYYGNSSSDKARYIVWQAKGYIN